MLCCLTELGRTGRTTPVVYQYPPSQTACVAQEREGITIPNVCRLQTSSQARRWEEKKEEDMRGGGTEEGRKGLDGQGLGLMVVSNALFSDLPRKKKGRQASKMSPYMSHQAGSDGQTGDRWMDKSRRSIQWAFWTRWKNRRSDKTERRLSAAGWQQQQQHACMRARARAAAARAALPFLACASCPLHKKGRQ